MDKIQYIEKVLDKIMQSNKVDQALDFLSDFEEKQYLHNCISKSNFISSIKDDEILLNKIYEIIQKIDNQL